MPLKKIDIEKELEKRMVSIESIAEIVYDIQENYVDINMDDCLKAVRSVLAKREVQITILFGIQVDILAERGMFKEPIQSLICDDANLFGLDEVLAVGIASLYGSIGFTNFGYLDKIKPRIIGELNTLSKSGLGVTTFIDDLVCAIAAAAAAKLAHTKDPRSKELGFSEIYYDDENNINNKT